MLNNKRFVLVENVFYFGRKLFARETEQFGLRWNSLNIPNNDNNKPRLPPSIKER